MKASELFLQIEQLITPQMDGWCIPEKACDFAAFILSLRPKVSVEIGVWGGRGTLSMALAHRFIDFGHVVAIDPWSASASIVGQTGKDLDYWSNQEMHDLVYGRFMKNLAILQLHNWVEVQRKRSDEATLPDVIDFAVLDGNHAEQAIADVDRVGKRVPVGGVVYLDDLKWTGGAVGRAAENLVKMGFRKLYGRDQGAFFQRV